MHQEKQPLLRYSFPAAYEKLWQVNTTEETHFPRQLLPLPSSSALQHLALSLYKGPDEGDNNTPNQYIIVLKDNSTKTPVQSAEEAQRKGANVLHIYQHALKGYSIYTPNEKVLEAIIKNNSDIAYVEADTVVREYPRDTDSWNSSVIEN